MQIKWDIKRGADIYRGVYDARLKNWISMGKIKAGEVFVWRSGFSGWRKPEELEELKPHFQHFEKAQLKRESLIRRTLPSKKEIKNILIIDDEKDLCELLCESLNRRKYNVTIANTKREAIDRLKREIPDLVFLDLKLPDGDGMNILSKIKKINPDTIVNIISAYGSEERKEEARGKGVYSFIDKPFTEREILRGIREIS
jgi:CheY-like chemotaxis protein